MVFKCLTKYAHLIHLITKLIAFEVFYLYNRHIHDLHGPPYYNISDRDPKFVSHLCEETFKLGEVTFNVSISYQLQIGGQAEVVNKFLACIFAYT